ncbi:NADPH dehydrogenase NamA [Ornithinibacillus sp. 4-3]|uniref:NADPH dehydrogenase NamA n=1 Tax=Ornithinibacillus sp. 4-3 TaxID=3231488 RepID=A0AB39HL58_9BACI
MVKLFSPITLKNITLKNRIVMSPMCMYSSMQEDGCITPFHLTHYISRAVGQVGLIMVEATAVQPEGRISLQDLGIWDEKHVVGLKSLTEQIHAYGSKAAIQLAHAGRKAELPDPIFAPSSISFDQNWKQPNEMTKEDIQQTIEAFKEGARRAKIAEFDIVEIHAAHGYLINQFLSPLANQRTDEYGGNRENRYRFLKEIIEAIRSEWQNLPLFVRISTDEYHQAGNSLDDILYFASEMKQQGIDLIDCSSGGVVPAKIDVYPGYQLPNCEAIKNRVGISTGAVGLITSGLLAEEVLQAEQADLIFIGRALLKNAYWPLEAAEQLKYQLQSPKQYERGWN